MDDRGWTGRVTRIRSGRLVRVRWDRGGGAVLPVGKLARIDLEYLLS